MAMLDAVLGVVNVAFFYAILIWLLVDSLRQSKRNGVAYLKRRPTVFSAVNVLANAVISVMNMAFAFYQCKTRRIIGYNSVSLALTWVLATIVSLYSMKTTLRENKREQHSDMEQRLLQQELEYSMEEDEEAFTNASMWSQLTFRRLNPIFRKGLIQKLELAHIPSVPHSETAENASFMLEESH